MLSKKFKEKIKNYKYFNSGTIKYFLKNKIINMLCLEVCSDCQYDCVDCGHNSFRSVYKNYHMTIHELNRFLYYTKKSNYHIKELFLHGPGEPTLWKNLNEGIKIIHESNVMDNIFILTNGVSVDRIEEETFQYIDILRISVYPDAKENDYLTYLQQKYPEKIKSETFNKFYRDPDRKYPDSTPCSCICPIPIFIDGKIFYCSGNVFDAAKLKGIDILDCHDLYSELKENYLENWDSGNYDLCKYCALNGNIFKQLKSYPHKLFGEKTNEQ